MNKLEPKIYETKDFNILSWHDCPIYSMKFDDLLEFDLDYIVGQEKQLDGNYKYLISPGSLLFYDVENIKMDIEADFLNGFEINRILKDENLWKIELQEGVISFDSSGFKFILRRKPLLKDNMFLSEEERT